MDAETQTFNPVENFSQQDKSFQTEPLEFFEIELYDAWIPSWKLMGKSGEDRKPIKITVSEGINLIYHGNGKLRYKFTIKNGKREGEFVEFFPNGHLAERELYENGVRKGRYIRYFLKGQQALEVLLKEGEEKQGNGILIKYNEFGIQNTICTMVNFQEHGWKTVESIYGNFKCLMIHGKEETLGQWLKRVLTGKNPDIPSFAQG